MSVKISRNLISAIVISVLLIALPILIYLVQQKQIFKPKADVMQIEFFGENTFTTISGSVGFTKIDGTAKIGVRLNSPYE